METNFTYKNIPVRVITDVNEQTWFAGIDICNILGYVDAHQKIKQLDDDEYRLDRIRDGQGKLKDTLTVNEFGLYSLILSSSKPEAKAFKRWITHDVLPAIRKAGKYTSEYAMQKETKIQELITQIEDTKNKIDIKQNELKQTKSELAKKQENLLKILKADPNQLNLFANV